MRSIAFVLNYPLQNQIDVGHLDVLMDMYTNALQEFDEVHVVSPRDKNKSYDLGDKRIIVHPMPHHGALLGFFSLFLDGIKLSGMAKKHGIKVMRAFGPSSGLTATIAGKLAHVPVIVSVYQNRHEVEKVEHINFIKKWFLDFIEPFVLKNADVVLVVSQHVWECMEKLGVPSNKIALHPNYVNTKLFKPSTGDHYGIVYFGRLSKVKGLEYLINAMPSINANEQTPLSIIGTGPESNKLKKLASSIKPKNDVIFTDALSHNDKLPNYIKSAELAVFPSLSEGFGMSIVEAMACGLPVIATNVGGIPEVVDDGVTGILVKPKSTSEIAKAVASLMSNKKLMASMRKAARDRATILYSIEGWKNRELFIYRKMISQ